MMSISATSTPGVQCGDNVSVRLDGANVVQPDALLRLRPEFGGQSRTSSEGYVEGAPELVVEIAATSASPGRPCSTPSCR